MCTILHKVKMLRWILVIWSESSRLFPWPFLAFLFHLSHHLFPYSFFPPEPSLLHSSVPSPLRLPVKVASLLSNSVRRLKGGNYIHAAWPLWTLSPLLPCLLTGNWFKDPHWHLRDGNRELWKCQRGFANVYVWICALMCTHRHIITTHSILKFDCILL